MTDARFLKLRLLRLLIWTILMCVAATVVGWYHPRQAFFVPCIFLVVMVPMVLLPMKNKPDKS